MKKNIIAITILSFISFVFGCGMVTGKGDAEEVAEAFFNERIQNGGVGDYYSELFWQNTDAKKWEGIKKLVRRTMGQLKSFELESWNVNTQAKTNDLSGTFVRLEYKTVYEKGQGVENLTLHKPLGGEEYTILGHHIDSPQIREAINKGIENAISSDGG